MIAGNSTQYEEGKATEKTTETTAEKTSSQSSVATGTHSTFIFQNILDQFLKGNKTKNNANVSASTIMKTSTEVTTARLENSTNSTATNGEEKQKTNLVDLIIINSCVVTILIISVMEVITYLWHDSYAKWTVSYSVEI